LHRLPLRHAELFSQRAVFRCVLLQVWSASAAWGHLMT
jgi:hypothetical protein